MRFAVVLLLLAVAPLANPAQKGSAQKEKKSASSTVISGCLDEKPEHYVIRTDDSLKELAALEPVGFDRSLFARFVGHKVSISGDLVTSTDPPTLRVRSYAAIKDVADMCVPAGEK